MGADRQNNCTSWWDCNLRDKSSWKKSGGNYYLLYQGSTYWGCDETTPGTNHWGIAIARSSSPLGSYDQMSGSPLMYAPQDGGCNIGYPTINIIDGATWLYYYVGGRGGPYQEKRSLLVWNSGTSAQSDRIAYLASVLTALESALASLRHLFL